MAHRLTVYIIDPVDKKIYVQHVFYGRTRLDAENTKARHLAGCEYFRAAEAAGMTDEEHEEIHQSEWPVAEPEGVTTIDMEQEES